MRFKRAGLLSVLIALSASACGRAPYAPFPPAEPHVPGISKEALRQAVAQLESDDWRVRQRAQDELFGSGQQALPALRAARAEARDPETSQRLDSTIRQIERIPPTLVTLDPRGKRASDAFRELGDQAGVTFTSSERHDPTLPRSLGKFDAVPFWVAAQRLCRASHMRPKFWTRGARTIELWAADPAFADRSCDGGAAFFDLTGTGRGVSPHPGSVFLQLFVYADPGLQVVRGPGNPVLTEAVDEHGRSLLGNMPTPEPTTEPVPRQRDKQDFRLDLPNHFGHWQWPRTIELPPPPSDSHRIVRLRGTASFQVSILGADWTIERPVDSEAMGVETETAGWRIRLEGVKQLSPRSWAFVVMLRSETDHVDVRLAEQFRQALRVSAFSPAGVPFVADAPHLVMAPDASYAKLACAFSTPGVADDSTAVPPARLVFQFPREMRVVDVPFEFTDIPMPGATSARR